MFHTPHPIPPTHPHTHTQQVVANALLLYALARHTLTYQNKTLMEKKMQLDQSESRLTKRGAYTLPRDDDGNTVLPSPHTQPPGSRRGPPTPTTGSTRKPLRFQSTPDVVQRDTSPGSFL